MEASKQLTVLAELTVSEKQVERVIHRVGKDRQEQRDAGVKHWQALPLPEQQREGPQPKAPSLAVVQFDGGRMQIRPDASATATADGEAQEGRSDEICCSKEPSALELAGQTACPDEAGATKGPDDETHSGHWRESKVGCLMTMQSKVHEQDPCPEIPATFVDPLRILKLTKEMGSKTPVQGAPAGTPSHEKQEEDERPGAPVPLVRTVVASRVNSAVFGGILAAAAWARGFAAAPRKAFVGDGGSMIWGVWKSHFSHYEPILDFIHALQYVFAAAMTGVHFSVGWPIYTRWIQCIWSGQVDQVLAELEIRQSELGVPDAQEAATSPRKIVATALGYLRDHRHRMDYARYRQLGLPIMSSYVESTVKQINQRAKGTEKFWSEPGAEAILQLRADYLSDTDPLATYWDNRQRSATGQRCYQRAA